MDQAVKHCTAGLSIWEWASNDKGGEPDEVMACCGDVPTLETLAAVDLLRQHVPELKVRVVKEEGTTTTPFDMAVLNQLDRFSLVSDVIDRVPKLGERAAYAQQAIREKLIDHKHYIAKHGDDMPEVRDWKWPGGAPAGRAVDTAADNA